MTRATRTRRSRPSRSKPNVHPGRFAALLFSAILLGGCAGGGRPLPAPPPDASGAPGAPGIGSGLRAVDPARRSVAAENGRYEVAIEGPSLLGSGADFGSQDADFGLLIPEDEVVLIFMSYDDPSVTLDMVTAHRRDQVRKNGKAHFEKEERFFLPSGRHRVASLAYFEGLPNEETRFLYSLVVAGAGGPIEVVGSTTRPKNGAKLRQAIMRLRLLGD